MTRKYVYWGTLAVFVAATALTLSSILRPHWLTFESRAQNTGRVYTQNMGLHSYCNSALLLASQPSLSSSSSSSIYHATTTTTTPSTSSSPSLEAAAAAAAAAAATKPCRHFPDQDRDCPANDRYFCSMWRTTGFLMSLVTVVELASLVCFMVVIGGGKAKREKGWRLLGWLMGVVCGVQVCALSLVAYLLDKDEKFLVPGWQLDSSWVFCAVSAGLTMFCVIGLVLSVYLLPPEEGYEFLEDPLDV